MAGAIPGALGAATGGGVGASVGGAIGKIAQGAMSRSPILNAFQAALGGGQPQQGVPDAGGAPNVNPDPSANTFSTAPNGAQTIPGRDGSMMPVFGDTSPYANPGDAAGSSTPPPTTPVAKAAGATPYVDTQVSAPNSRTAAIQAPTPQQSQADPAAGNPLWRAGIAKIETGSPQGDYSNIGPVTGNDRPYGKYQIMGNNIPEWTKAALGKSMTPNEFLKNPQAQDATFDHRFGQYAAKYGPEGAAQAWLGGEGSVGKVDRKDNLGTSVGSYGKQFMNNINGDMTSPQEAADNSQKTQAQRDPAARVMQQIPGNPGWQGTSDGSPVDVPTTPIGRVLDALIKTPHHGHADLNAQAPQAQPGQSVDTGAQDVANAAQATVQKSATPSQKAATRKATITAKTRYQA